MGTDELQTMHLCENPPHAPANSNFILTLIQCALAFKYHIPLKTCFFLFSVRFSIDTWSYLSRVSLAFAYDLCRRSRRQTRVIACKRRRVRVHGRGQDKITFSHNALLRLAILNIEVISLLLKCSHCVFHMVLPF